MNKFIAIVVIFAVFATASAQILYSGAYSSPIVAGHYAAAPVAYTAPLTTGHLAAAPLTTAWTSHYAAAPLAYAWKK